MRAEEDMVLDDGFGNLWERCGPGCDLEIVRPGKVQCSGGPCGMNDNFRTVTP